MANYSTSTHSLSFSSDYKTLQVSDSTGIVASYPLDNGDDSVSLTVSGSDYEIDEGDDFDTAIHKIAAPAQAGITFSGSQMDGIGIIDLRDTNRSGNFSIQYDLECTTYNIKYKVGASEPVWFEFINSNCCYTITEE